MRNRFYDPQSGKFTQEDPIGIEGGLNVYGYAAGDPVNYSDPYGLCPDDPIHTCPAWLLSYVKEAGEDAAWSWADVANNSTGVKHYGAVAMGVAAAACTPETCGGTIETLRAGATGDLPTLLASGGDALRKVHGNRLDSGRAAEGYTLRDLDTNEVLKYGETTRGTRRYS
jgi:hypothetical protein